MPFYFPRSSFPDWRRYILIDEEEHLPLKPSEKDVEEEEHLDFVEEAQPRSSSYSFLWKVAGILIVFLGGFIVGGLSALSVRHNTTWTLEKSPYPVFSRSPKAVIRMPEFMEPASPKSNELWDSLMPFGLFFHLPQGETKWGLKPGMPNDPFHIEDTAFDAYGMTWTHEYHCLAHVRKDFWDLVYGESDLAHKRGHVEELDVNLQNRLGHNAHCLDYLRQLIVCRGDTTPEPRSSTKLGNGYPYHLDGYDTIHQCVDHDAIVEYMGEHLAEFYQVGASSQPDA